MTIVEWVWVVTRGTTGCGEILVDIFEGVATDKALEWFDAYLNGLGMPAYEGPPSIAVASPPNTYCYDGGREWFILARWPIRKLED